jgi:lipopolysaccharide transport system ATP-binding protein
MSSEVSLVARGVGKRYDLFKNHAGRLIKEFLPIEPGSRHWALRGFDMEAKPGECVGIIGRNGSGKSTLLGMLAGIVTPTEGTLDVRGRVVALLELGAGFHSDFSGRDNVYLSAAIYGMSEAETEARFDSIEQFAGIGEYIDRPVRQYSSGMFARLAFAVAAHVDADILIIDEILGVGDIRFQQRCSRFISQFRKRGGIVLLVSHSEHMIVSLCTHAIWLANGKMQAAGAPRPVAHAYHSSTHREGGAGEGTFATTGRLAEIAVDHRAAAADPKRWTFDELPDATGTGSIVSCQLLLDGEPIEAARGGEDVTLRLVCDVPPGTAKPVMGFVLRDRMGQVTFGADSGEFGAAPSDTGRVQAEFAFRLPYLPSGGYGIDAALLDLGNESVRCLARDEEAGMIEVLSRHISAGMANVALQRAEFFIDGERLAP